MQLNEQLTGIEPLGCLASVSDRAWALMGRGELEGDSCFVVDMTDASRPLARGYYDASTGDVHDCTGLSGDMRERAARSLAQQPAVHLIGEVDGKSGQLTVRQEQGNYLRLCRWDRVDGGVAGVTGARLRTLPQCGCGGSLGAPKLFGSFAEMGAYHFCAFYL